MSMGCCESKCAGDITSEQWALVDEIIAKYKGQRGILIPCLHEIQEVVGYLPLEVQERVAAGLDVPLADVYSVVTFYALFSTKPKGKHQVGVCLGTACYVRGGDKVLEKVEQALGIKAGDTTDDRLFSIQVMRCIGACGLGPVMTVDDDIYARIKPDRVAEVLAKYS
ncbi:MAG TPA: NAD(P)H-dependent oxidoreductase subunit E [Firmicutes bacterium]|jgi:NADP-reducing hydrogenase subunit HndA|nr:NAD(P)H-dependent oxidoreductase subunit E [Bacillota bacterium]